MAIHVGDGTSGFAGATTFSGTVTTQATTDITVPAGQDFALKLGDAAGSNVFAVQDSAGTAQFSVTSNADITIYNAENDGNPVVSIGAAAAERVEIQPVFDAGAQTLNYVLFQTKAASATADKGKFVFQPDEGSNILIIDDGGLEVTGSVNATAGFTDGTMTIDGSGAISGVTTLAMGGALSGVTTLTMGGALSGVTTLGLSSTITQTGGDYTIYENVNNADPYIGFGTSATEALKIQSVCAAGSKTLSYVEFSTATADATADYGKYIFDVDGSDILTVDDGGLEITGTVNATGGFTDGSMTIDGSGAITGVTSLGMGGALSGVTTLGMGGDLTNYEAANDANPSLFLGSAAAERLEIQSVYDAGAQTLNYVQIQTYAASATANKGEIRIGVDGTDILHIDDGGIEVTGDVQATTGTFAGAVSGITTLGIGGTITGVTTAITGTKNNALQISIPTQGTDDADGVGIIIAADAAGSGGAGNHNGGSVTLTPGAKAGGGAVGNINLGTDVRIDEFELALEKVSDVAGANSLHLSLEGKTSGGDREMDIYLDTDAGTDTYRMAFATHSGAQIMELESDGQLTLIPQNAAAKTTTAGYQYTGHLIGTVQTTDATQTALATFTLDTDQAVTCEAIVSAILSDGSKGYHAIIAYGARKDGAAAAAEVLANTVLASANSDVAVFTDITFSVTGNTVVLNVTGAAASTINWVANVRYTVADI